MLDWREYLRILRAQAERVPTIGWLVGGVIAVALAAVLSMEMSSPPYAALYEGLSPAQGGAVIAQLQKLGIPYELQAAGNVILVPAPQLAAARLQLGAAQVPEDDAAAGWNKLEDAPMTTSDIAQSAMASQALEASLEQSIDSMAGIESAKVYLALPADTPFLADQPKPTASVVIEADASSAEAQGPAIANLVAGAVPGLSAQQVTVETTSGVAVYPAGAAGATSSQFQTVAQIESAADARVAQLLTPLVGAGNFRADVSANVDFTQEHIHQVAYGPSQVLTHQVSDQTNRTGSQDAAIGIPGALSNEPPAATTAATPPVPVAGAAPAAGTSPAGTANASGGQAAGPEESSKNLDQTYDAGQSESDITKPDWAVNSIAVSVVLNKAALGGTSIDQVKAAIAGAFAYKTVTVNVLAAPFQAPGISPTAMTLAQEAGPVSRALLEVMAAAALMFGVALPLGRRLGMLGERVPAVVAPVPVSLPRPVPVALPRRDLTKLRAQANENLAGVAKLLQSWVEENE
jgi:flagellar M-ring protein FliF